MVDRHRNPYRTRGGVLAVCLLLAGCGQQEVGYEGKRVPVTGRVTFTDGKPLPRGMVIFTPDAAKGNSSRHEPRGPIVDDGKYTLATSPQLVGVLPGSYKVTIVAQEPYDNKRSDWDPPWIINRRYGNRDKSGLTAEVVEHAEPGRYDFQVGK
jgi:hypothetical protein